ncbi:MAG: TolC family protein [Algoriphagus sp.]|uniref:TolC family protein n=1 Tax=Algoriphagus sp. TaxID=1872435 RepID=UPI00274B53AD|nr:TolC family protein [Algoriphagus sp.]MDP5125959.1 TolC family protein [Algoriphagus sp.]
MFPIKHSNRPIRILIQGFFLLIGLQTTPIQAQQVLDTYIKEGLANNLVLQEKNASLEQSLVALRDAKSYFLPSVDFGASYTLAEGGRTIAFPVGDLLNPVYSTLNKLTASNSFPQIANVSEQLLPDNFYDTRFRTTVPVLNTDLIYQNQIRKEQVNWTNNQVEIYRASLIQDIRVAYFNFCAAHTSIEILTKSLQLVEQNLKDTRSLVENGKRLPAAVLRAESELEQVKSLLTEAKLKTNNAAYYLNFLVNRPLDQEVAFEQIPLNISRVDQLLLEDLNAQNPELRAMQSMERIQETVLKSGKNYWIPKLSTYADLGSQGFDWNFDTQSRYLLWGLNFSVPVFQGGRNQNQIQRNMLGLQAVQRQKELVNQKLNLNLQLQRNEVKTLLAALQSAEKKLISATAYLNLVDKAFKDGSQSLLEYIDARNQYTQAALLKNISSYKLQMSLAQLERQLTTETN